MKKLIIFDCDGTLVDSEVIATQVFTAYWATHGVVMTETEFKEKFIGTGSNAPVVIENLSKMPAHADEEGDALLDEALSKYLTAVDGISTLLSSLNFEMCVASNSSLKYVKKALIKTKLTSYFGEKVFSSEQVDNPKPAPDLFIHASSVCGYQIEDCIVVEDSVSGVRAAQNANMKVIGFSGAGHFIPSLEEKLKAVNPDWFCSTTSELHELLNSF
ncbi:HAD-IA family hydrolase [Bacteriovoracaceae bacterium]|nr:HAD-IA family hydrolase [Bacteriovoracaceae bacterium]